MVTLRILLPVAVALTLTLAPALSSCHPVRRELVIPKEMRRTPTPAQRARPIAVTGAQGVAEQVTYTLRMSEGGRIWEVVLPASAGGYQVRVPMIVGMAPPEVLTAADREFLAANRGDGGVVLEIPGRAVDAEQHAVSRSYLGGIHRVTELYRSRRYELALIELVDLETVYPEDARLLAMKGSVFLKLNQLPQARAAYQRALALNPEDLGVAEALRQISEGE